MLIILRVKVYVLSAYDLTTTLSFLLYHVYHYFLHLLSINHKYTHPCYFSCYSEDGDGIKFFDEEF
jgi:hypothetical protein